MSPTSENNDPELIQYFSIIISIVCAIICASANYKLPKWRKVNYLYSKQILVKCIATCCVVGTFLVPNDYKYTILILFFIILLSATLGTVLNIVLSHIYIVLNCQPIEDEETKVTLSWYRLFTITSLILYIVQSALDLDLLNIGTITVILLLGLETGNVILLSSIFKIKCSLNITVVWFVNILGILSDVLLILFGFLLLYMDDVQWAYDFIVVTCTGVVVVQTFVIMINKNAMDWKKCCPSISEDIEM